MTNLTLYTAVGSRGSNIIWMLEESGLECNIITLGFPGLKKPEYLAINPMGKVPALKHGDTIITETLAILAHLAELVPQKQLIPPAGSIERGEYYRWMCFALHLEYAAIDRWRGIENNDKQRGTIGYGDLATVLATLKNHLHNRKHIIGEHFSTLDLYYSGLFVWLINRMQLIAADPVFTTYMQHHLSRPAVARAQEKEAALKSD